MVELLFRRYAPQDRDRCLAMFDANCPEYFAINERSEYSAYLDNCAASYALCEVNGELAGGFGLSEPEGDARSLNWILLVPTFKGRGLGSRILEHVAARCRDSGSSQLLIAASHRSAPFFGRCGATIVNRTEHGWGPGMHRVDMRLDVAVQR